MTEHRPGAELRERRTVVVGAGHPRSLLADLFEVAAYWQVLHELLKRDLKVRYKRSVLGLAWTMLNPLLMMVVTTIVFANVFRFAIDNFPIYVLSAYVVWGFFTQSTTTASTSLLTSAGLIRKIYLPPALFPLVAVYAAAVNLILALVPLFLLTATTGGQLTSALLFLPVAIALTVLFTCGVALILATASVFFHDAIYVYQAVSLAWMYLTPLFYPVEIVPEGWVFILQLNPMFHLIQLFRDPIHAGSLPDPTNIAAAAGYAVAAAGFGWWYFERSRDAFAGYL